MVDHLSSSIIPQDSKKHSLKAKQPDFVSIKNIKCHIKLLKNWTYGVRSMVNPSKAAVSIRVNAHNVYSADSAEKNISNPISKTTRISRTCSMAS